MGYNATVYLPDDSTTTRLGEALATCLRDGDTILLEGQIGTGKTHFARAVIRKLFSTPDQPEIEIPSPTFTLVQTYLAPGLELWHADLYRLSDPSEIEELGLLEAFQSAIVLVEWPDRLSEPPDSALTIHFDYQGDGRIATLSSPSSHWEMLNPALAHE